MARLGIDLSGDSIALAEVRPAGTGVQLRAYALLEPIPDRNALMEALRAAREAHRFPLNAEVVAWAGEPRVSAVRAAGYFVERVILPGAALARVARLYGGLSTPPSDGVTALVSLDETSGTIAIVRDATVLYEAPITWSSSASPTQATASSTDLLRRYAFIAEVTELLHSAFATVQRGHGARVSKLLTCGSLSDLRSLTMALAEEFDVEVETLDSAANVDASRVRRRTPEEAEAALAALQIAMVASRRWHEARPPLRWMLRVAAVLIGVAAVGYAIYAGGFLAPLGSSRSSGRSGSAEKRGVGAGPPRLRDTAPPTSQPPHPDAGIPEPTKPDPTKPGPTAGDSSAAAQGRPADNQPHAANPTNPSDRGNRRNLKKETNPRNVKNVETLPQPISLSLTSILWSADRKLVIVEGQVLGIGDTIGGMTIVEIQPDGVILRDGAGQLRRAELRRPPDRL